MRTMRRESGSSYYHVTARGNGRQLLFENDQDREKFLDLIREARDEHDMRIIAWCLMDNHVHLLVQATLDDLSKAMKSVCALYAQYFNWRTGHVGHVFQGRFHSEPIENESHLLEAVRYIHANPEDMQQGLSRTYEWSSYQEYLGNSRGVACTSLILGMLGGVKQFEEFHAGKLPVVPSYVQRRLTSEEALLVADEVLGVGVAASLKSYPKSQRDKAICTLRNNGLSIRQIERITGIGRGTIAKAS